MEQAIAEINAINSKLRGLINYYQCCTWVNIILAKYSRRIELAGMKWLKRFKGKWIRANKVRNLPRIHAQYKTLIPAIKYGDIWIGITNLTFVKWEKTPSKNQQETPYSQDGREIHFLKTKKKRIYARLDELYSPNIANSIVYGRDKGINNFEFIMNRAYALNRDKVRCKVCGGWLIDSKPWTHRINPNLPISKINKAAKRIIF